MYIIFFFLSCHSSLRYAYIEQKNLEYQYSDEIFSHMYVIVVKQASFLCVKYQIALRMFI